MQRRTFLAAGAMAAGAVSHGFAAHGTAGEQQALAAKPARIDEVDVLVCGGGPAGMAAATVAARQGARWRCWSVTAGWAAWRCRRWSAR